jgi:hypothetical protein
MQQCAAERIGKRSRLSGRSRRQYSDEITFLMQDEIQDFHLATRTPSQQKQKATAQRIDQLRCSND